MSTTMDIFEDQIQKAVRQRVGEVLQREVIDAQKRLTEALRKEADHLALSVLSYYQVDRLGTELRITVKKEI